LAASVEALRSANSPRGTYPSDWGGGWRSFSSLGSEAPSTASDHGAEQLVTCWPPLVPSLATKVAQPSVAALQEDTCVWPAAQDVWLVEQVHTSPVVQQTPLGSEHVVLLPLRSRAQ